MSFSSQEYKEEAIPFVIFSQEKRIFEVNDEAIEFLNKLPGPLGIISVAGMYRTGKSYLLNRMLLNRSGGFGVGPTINPCTKGIWVWGKPISGFTPEGEPINVLVLDTEGLGALDEDSNHDVRIFSLAILISSYFLYNSVGSIDENALSQLSLVINLTKHIHLKSTGVTEDIDPEEYSQYFPSFMWVVRDFALQLVDMEGEPMTSKEYLEKALQPQKGFSDGIEQKNRIRRLMKSFFKERDCCTMIRPLTKEENLQILEKLALEELRPEFVEQVMQLRRKVINRIKPKLIHGKKLNGQMLCNLAVSYVDAINKGAVPNIESSWIYICKNECLKAQYEAYDRFERTFAENYEIRAPLFDDELKEIYQEAKRAALDEFSKVAVGEVQRQFLVELKDKIKHKFNMIKQENEKQAENNYSAIEKKLKNQEYGSIYDLVEDLKRFQLYFEENGPPGPNRRTILFEFCNKALAEASEYFFKTVTNELSLQRQLAEEMLKKLQIEIKEIKDEQRTKIDFFENKLRSSELEKAELSAKEQNMKENLSQLQKERQQLEIEMTEKVDNLKKENNRQLEEVKNKAYQSEEHVKEIQRQQMSADSEHEKQKALLEQKLEFLERSLEEAQKKEKEISNELKLQKKDNLNSAKEISLKCDQQIKEFQKKIETQSEQIFDWENKFSELEQKYEQDKLKFDDLEVTLKRDLQKTKDQFNELNKQNDVLKKKYSTEVEQLKQNSEEDKNFKNERIIELEQKVKQSEETYQVALQKWEKDQAIYKQKQEFLEVQLKEERKKNEEQRDAHDQIIRNIQSRERESVIGKEEASKRVAEIKEAHSKEYQELEQKYESQRKRLSDQIDQLQERNQELELSLKIQVGDFEKEVLNLREQLQISEEQRNRLLESNKSLDSQKLKLLQETDIRHKVRETELEREIEDKTRDFETQVKEMQIKSEDQLLQLKNYYEIEKERVEKRLQEEKDRAVKRYNQMLEDYEQKLKEEQQQHEDDVQMVQDELTEKEASLKEYIQQLEHENSLKQQQIESLQKYLEETKEALSKIQQLNSNHLDQQLDRFNEERKELISKIEKLTGEITRKERIVTTLENQKETFTFQLQQKEKALIDQRNEHNQEKNALLEKIEQTRSKLQESLDELSQRKIEFERDKALKAQQLIFQDQRIGELQKQLEDTVRRYEERIRSDREELHREMQEKVQRISAEKDASDAKYEQKRKALKDLESNINKQTSQMEREKAVLLEKYQNLETLQKDLIKNYESEIQKLRETNEQLSLTLSSDKQAIHEEVERWRREYNEIERNYADLQNQLDRDKALWEGKFKFLEQQRDNAKKDLEEAQRKFQQTVEQLQKTQNDNKSKSENTHQMLITQMEAKFNQRIKEIQESNQQLSTELQSKNKQLERENKLLMEKIELSSKSNQSQAGSLEKKLEKSLENENKLADELEQIKADRDMKIIEYQKLLDKERENYKNKLRDLEGKGTSVQTKQTELLLNFEKERAKWEHEKSYIINQKEDACDNSQRLEKKVESLLRENEKLKNDLRTNRKQMYQAAANTSNYQAAMVGTNLAAKLGNLGSFKSSNNILGGDSGDNVPNTQRSAMAFQPKSSQLTLGGGIASSLANLGGISAGLNTNREIYQGIDKSFQSNQNTTQGAVGGLQVSSGLDVSLLNNMNILSTPSSEKSGRRSSTFSPDDNNQKQ